MALLFFPVATCRSGGSASPARIWMRSEQGSGAFSRCKVRVVDALDQVMGHNLWFHSGVDEHPFATYFDVHQGYRVLTHSQI